MPDCLSSLLFICSYQRNHLAKHFASDKSGIYPAYETDSNLPVQILGLLFPQPVFFACNGQFADIALPETLQFSDVILMAGADSAQFHKHVLNMEVKQAIGSKQL